MRCRAENRRTTNVPNRRRSPDHGAAGVHGEPVVRPARRGSTPRASAPVDDQREHGRPGAGDHGGEPVGPQPVDQRRARPASPGAGSPGAGSRGWPARAGRGGRPARPRAARPSRRWRPRRRAAPASGSSPRATSVDSGSGGTNTAAPIRASTGDADGVRLAAVVAPGDDEAAEQRRGDVVGVALDARWRASSSAASSSRSSPAVDQRAGQHQPADDRRRRRAEAAGVRDRVAAA